MFLFIILSLTKTLFFQVIQICVPQSSFFSIPSDKQIMRELCHTDVLPVHVAIFLYFTQYVPISIFLSLLKQLIKIIIRREENIFQGIPYF